MATAALPKDFLWGYATGELYARLGYMLNCFNRLCSGFPDRRLHKCRRQRALHLGLV